MTMAILVTTANAACGVRMAQPPSPPATEMYTFPLSMPGKTLICVEAVPLGYAPCITLRRLRDLARDTEAN